MKFKKLIWLLCFSSFYASPIYADPSPTSIPIVPAPPQTSGAPCITSTTPKEDAAVEGLESEAMANSAKALARNCYAFSRGNDQHIPGGSKGPVALPAMVNMKSLKVALPLDGGIPLGLNPSQSSPELDPGFDPKKNYYLVAAMVAREEYHFVRLF